jgi:hypothetical protein
MYFDSNLKYLQQLNAELLPAVQAANLATLELVEVMDTFAVKQVDDEGKEYYSCSIFNPYFEADAFLQGTNFDNTGYVVLGINGKAVIEKLLREKTEAAWLFIVEHDLRLIRQLLTEVDFAKYTRMQSVNVVFFTGSATETSRHLKNFIDSKIGYYFLRAELIRTYPTHRTQRAYYQAVFDALKDAIKDRSFSSGNQFRSSLNGIGQEIHNLKYILRYARLSDLRDRYAGKPIVCVASGPSLDKQLPLLREYQNNVIIICAESSFRPLVVNGIEPDVVCVLERGKEALNRSFKDVSIPAKTCLFILSLVDPQLFEFWPNEIVPLFKKNALTSKFINDALGDFGAILTGHSVAHMSLMLADYFGGGPITLIGQDLARSNEGAMHSRDTMHHLIRQQIIEEEKKKGEPAGPRKPTKNYIWEKVLVDGYYGGKVSSTRIWSIFLYWMESLITLIKQPVINATEGGANIRGAHKMPFKQVLETYCNEPVMPMQSAVREFINVHHDLPEKMTDLVRAFRQLQDDLRRFIARAQVDYKAMQNFYQELKTKGARVPELNQKINETMRDNEKLLHDLMAHEYIHFFFRPIVALLFIKTNPMSRIHSIEIMIQILEHYMRFAGLLIDAGEKLHDVIEKNLLQLMIDVNVSVEREGIAKS